MLVTSKKYSVHHDNPGRDKGKGWKNGRGVSRGFAIQTGRAGEKEGEQQGRRKDLERTRHNMGRKGKEE